MARDEGWLAEHMLILKLTNPEGKVHYIGGAFPSACGKTNLGHADSHHSGWKVRDHGGRHRVDEVRARMAGSTRSIPSGLLRRGSGHEHEVESQRDALAREELDLHQRGPHTRRRRLVGGADGRAAAAGCTDWHGNPWTPKSEKPAAHPNARFTAPAGQCPVIGASGRIPGGADQRDALRWAPRGVVPLVHEALDWQHGIFLGSVMGSETTPRPPGRSARCGATRWRCCRSADTTWPTTRRTGSGSANARARSSRRSST